MIKNGIVYCEQPIKENIFKFLFDHLDCNCVIKKQDMSQDTAEIIAYATEEKYNTVLDSEFSNNDSITIMQGIRSQEVNSID